MRNMDTSKSEQIVQWKEMRHSCGLFRQISPEVTMVLKLCLAVMAFTFSEVDYHNSNGHSMKENSLESQYYTPMSYIPVNVIKFCWETLLDLNTDSGTRREINNEETNKDHERLDGFWKKFIKENDRAVFLDTVKKSGMRDNSQFIQDQLVALGFLQINVLDPKIHSEVNEVENDWAACNKSVAEDTYSCLNLMDNKFMEIRCLDDTSPASGWIGHQRSHDKSSLPQNNQTYYKCMIAHFMKYANNEDRSLELCKITDKRWHQYSIRLSKLSMEEGGFSSSFDECFATFNKVMVEACLKTVKGRPQPSSHGSFRVFEKIFDWNTSSKDSSVGHDFSSYIWIEHHLSNQSNIFIDEKLFYTIQMLPSHLMRAQMPEKAISLLSDTNYAHARAALGITAGAALYSQNCEELRLHCQWKGIVKFKRVILAVYDSYHRVLLKEHPVNELGKEVVGESYPGEVGNILHRFGSDLAYHSSKGEALKYYEEALHYKITALGTDSLSVAHTLCSIAKLQLRQHKLDMGLLSLEQALQIERKKIDQIPLQVAKTM